MRSSFASFVHVTRSVSNARCCGSSMRSTWTFPMAVKSSDLNVELNVLGRNPQVRLAFAKHDAVAYAVDAAAHSVGREARVIVVEAPRLRRDVVVQHVAAVQIDRRLIGRERRRTAAGQDDLDDDLDRRTARPATSARALPPKRPLMRIGPLHGMRRRARASGTSSVTIEHRQQQPDRRRADSRKDRRTRGPTLPATIARRSMRLRFCQRPSGAMMPLMPVAAARTT